MKKIIFYPFFAALGLASAFFAILSVTMTLVAWHELPDINFEFLLTKNHPGRTFTPKTRPEYDVAQAAIIPAAVPLNQQAMTELNKITGPSGTIMRCIVAGVAINGYVAS